MHADPDPRTVCRKVFLFAWSSFFQSYRADGTYKVQRMEGAGAFIRARVLRPALRIWCGSAFGSCLSLWCVSGSESYHPNKGSKPWKGAQIGSYPYNLACHLQIGADPDPAYHFDADPYPDSTYLSLDADPDPTYLSVWYGSGSESTTLLETYRKLKAVTREA